MRQDGEPTIEEILESIKRVIAREDRGERPPPTLATPLATSDELDRKDDVLDLAQHDYAAADRPQPKTVVPMVSETSSAGVRGSLDTLAAAAAPSPAAAPTPAGNALEPLIRELLRPALSDWLDRNLPAIVERMVAAEIARITRPGEPGASR